MSGNALVIAAWLCHGALLGAATLGIMMSALPVPGRIALAAAAALPLAAAIPGLLHRRRYTYQWLAFALVVYAGAGAVEVVATSGRSPFATIALLAALIELGVLFTLNRTGGPPPQGNRGSAGS